MCARQGGIEGNSDIVHCRREAMAEKGGARQGGGDAGGVPAWTPPPMAPDGGGGKKPWYHRDNYYPGVPRPAPGTPCGDRGAVILRTDPCVIYDPDIVRNDNFLKSMTAEDIERYKGEWIGIAGGGIVAHGKEYTRVHEETCKADKGEPLVHYIGPTEEGGAVFLGFW